MTKMGIIQRSKSMKPRIAILFAGGTIGMVAEKKSGYLRPAKNAAALLRVVPELKTKLAVDFFPLYNMDSSNMQPEHWEAMGAKVAELYDAYDGFVIAQGTDTMAYSASAHAFMLQKLGKPVVFTGSIVPLSELGADGRNNLIYSCLVASMDIAEVCIVFGDKIIRGCRAKKNHETFVDVFHSPNFPLLGEIGRPIKLFEWRRRRSRAKLQYHPHFEPNVRLVKLFPGLPTTALLAMIEDGARGFVIEGYGPGNVPFLGAASLMPFLKRARKQHIPVVITTQMERSQTNPHAYEAGHKAIECGAIPSYDMTTEAAVTKLMWVLGQVQSLPEVRRLFTKNIAGEFSS